MRAIATSFLGFLCLVTTACGPDPRPVDAESCKGYGPNGNGGACNGSCVDLSSDPLNCGHCGNYCDTGANACVGGVCVCRSTGGSHASKTACTVPAACDAASGLCLTPDPDGAFCDPIDGTNCPDHAQACVSGHCTVPDCNHPEICNLLDDDCDGLTDATGVGQPLTQPCYTGPAGTASSGICHGGVKTCIAGVYPQSCPGEQVPVPEDGFLRCDGVDNDCNACADNIWTNGTCEPPPPLKADIVFIIDRSGSMIYTISAVISAVQSWATNIGTNPNIRFALVDPTVIYDNADGMNDGVKVTIGLSSYLTFNNVMAGVAADGSGREPMHYATQRVMDGTFDASLGFAPDAIRLIIVIHDESTVVDWTGNVVAGFDESTVCGSVPANTVLAVITYQQWFPEWDLCTSTSSTPPTEMQLTDDPAAMLANLNLIIETPCF